MNPVWGWAWYSVSSDFPPRRDFDLYKQDDRQCARYDTGRQLDRARTRIGLREGVAQAGPMMWQTVSHRITVPGGSG